MNSKIILVVIILFSIATYSCKEEEGKVDLTTSLIGSYSGEFTWTTYMEVRKESGIITIKKIDENHVEISDNIGLYLNHLNFMEVYAKDLNGIISIYQNITSPGFENPLWGTNLGIYAWGSINENKLYLSFNGINFTGNFVQ